jgi:hypothetical protein
LCANTGWHRHHARKALKAALQPKVVTARSPRPVKYGPDVIAALTVCWTVLGMPAGMRQQADIEPARQHCLWMKTELWTKDSSNR